MCVWPMQCSRMSRGGEGQAIPPPRLLPPMVTWRTNLPPYTFAPHCVAVAQACPGRAKASCLNGRCA